MLHDEEIYPDPFDFKPERFMKGDQYNHDLMDPEEICFGFGKRYVWIFLFLFSKLLIQEECAQEDF